jgi:hypothetical protein
MVESNTELSHTFYFVLIPGTFVAIKDRKPQMIGDYHCPRIEAGRRRIDTHCED